MPKGRTHDYAIWRACERFGILPPNVQTSWDDCDVWTQCLLLGFDQVRQMEDFKQESEMMAAMMGASIG